MNTLKFKTTIKCSGCISQVTPYLESVKEAAGKWNVDIQDPNKILTVEADKADAEKIIEAVKKAGYQVEQL